MRADIRGGCRVLKLRPNYYIDACGSRYGQPEGDALWLGLRVGPRHGNPGRSCHGGMLTALADVLLQLVLGAGDTPLVASSNQTQSANTCAGACSCPYAVPPTVRRSMRKVGWPTPTGTLCPSLPHTPTPVSSCRSLPIMLTRVIASGPLPISVAPFTG
jgi:hypothetical protein